MDWIVHSDGGRGQEHEDSGGVKCEKMPPGGQRTIGRHVVILLCAACTGCICDGCKWRADNGSLPQRCLHGVHPLATVMRCLYHYLCLGAACTGCIASNAALAFSRVTLPRRCLHGVHLDAIAILNSFRNFASALPARGALDYPLQTIPAESLCLGAACTGCIASPGSAAQLKLSLPRRCLHGVHWQKPTNCGTPFCSIRRESVDSFSEINNKDSCADYFPALFCCQGDLHHHYRQPRTGNRPVLRCEQHRLFLFILSSHYRRLL